MLRHFGVASLIEKYHYDELGSCFILTLRLSSSLFLTLIASSSPWFQMGACLCLTWKLNWGPSSFKTLAQLLGFCSTSFHSPDLGHTLPCLLFSHSHQWHFFLPCNIATVKGKIQIITTACKLNPLFTHGGSNPWNVLSQGLLDTKKQVRT